MTTATADLVEAVGAHAAARPDALAAAAAETSLTWLQLGEAVAELAGTIGGWGLEAGARVVLAMPSSPGWVAAFLAGRRAGLTVVSAGSPRSAAELRELCLEVGAEAVLVDGAAGSSAQAVAERLGLGFLRLSDPRGAIAPVDCLGEGRSPGVAALHFTSGSTGERKAVPRSEPSLLNEGRAIAAALDAGSEPLLIVSPVFHSFGAGLLSAALVAGAPSILVPSFSVGAVLASIAGYSAAVLAGVPYVFHCLARIQRRRRYDLGSLRLGIAGGTPLHSHVARWFEAGFGAPLAQEYGLSEVGVVSINLDDPAARPRSVGRPLPGLEARLRPLPGEDGELTICRSSERDPGSEEMVEAVATGDLARIDGDGFVEITGRLKHLVNVGGLKVAPHDVERRLLASCGVEEVAIVACPDSILGERVGAAVVAPEGMTQERFRDDCRRVLAPHEIPRRIAWLRELPRLPSGKPDLIEIGRLLAPGERECGR